MISINRLFRLTEIRRFSAGTLLLTLFIGMFIVGINLQPVRAATITVPTDYSTIQAAINAANPGDTVFVKAGTHNGQVIINKTVSLVGENRASTIINETAHYGDVVIIEANDVLISNFTITGHKDPGGPSGPAFYVEGNGITIEDCNNTSIVNMAIPSGNVYGIAVLRAYGTTLNSSTVEGNIYGVEFTECDNTLLADNVFRNNRGYTWSSVPVGWGLYLYYCNNVTMRRNQFNNNIEDFRIDGDELSNFLHDIDTSNVFIDGITRKMYYLINQHDKAINVTGYPDLGCLALVNSSNIDVQGFDLLDISPGVLLAYTNDSYVRNNTIEYCTWALELVHSSNNIVSGNVFAPNNTGVVRVKYYSTNNTFEDNVVSDNTGNAFYFTNASQNIIENNTLTNNGGGIDLTYSDNNSLLKNNITDCGNGIHLGYSCNDLLRNNKMDGNGVNFQIEAYYDTQLSQFIHDIDLSNSIDGEYIYYLINHHSETITPSNYPNAGFLALINSTDITTQDMLLHGMLLGYTNNSRIQRNTLVDGADSITMVRSNANDVKENNVTSDSYGIRLYDYSKKNLFTLNNVTKAGDGISLTWHCDNNTVTENRLTNVNSGVMIGEYTTNTVVTKNHAANNYQSGVDINWESKFNFISENNITGSGDDGIRINSGSNNTIVNNYVIGSDYDGIRCDGGSNNTISGNTIKDQGNSGIAFRYDSYNNTAISNNIKNSTSSGIQLYILPTHNNIIGNNITDSGEDGVYIWMSGLNIISQNNITNSTRDGFHIEGSYSPDYPEYTAAFACWYNNITYNNVTQIGRYGVYTDSGNSVFQHNRFVNYSQATLTDPAWPNTWDDGYPSGGNYWSNYNGVDLYSGPNQNILGGDGIGDTPYIMNGNNTDRYPLMQTPLFSITIAAHCNTESADVGVPTTKDGVSSGQNTPHTFAGLLGNHTFSVPSTDQSGHPFKQWNTGQTSTTITVTSAGTYTAIYEAPTYNATVKAYCNTETTDINVPLTKDGTPSGQNTPYKFTALTGTHTFTVPNTDGNGHKFKQWSTGETSTTITITSEGTYTAIYEEPPPPPYDVTINAHCNTQATDINVAITKDGTTSGHNTPYSFTGLTGSHTFTVPSTDADGHPFKQWSTGETSTTITVTSGGTYTAIYEGTTPSPTPPPQTYCVTIKAYCNTQHSSLYVGITKDGASTGKKTSYTFSGLTGTHTFTVPSKEPCGHSFKQWNTGETSTTIIVSSGGTYTAYYEALPTPPSPSPSPAPTSPPCHWPFRWYFPIWNFFWWFWH